ncbi:hypothetical protein K7X08_013073 [Anisodus acutangulus]|uniref:Uncharacterized protein n=1 Tax=Anisodus acutangulus TaxID=402998 RepID=A0A9Q1RH10_9SOLA|nr:hypothetical protein K7X08_013073 [Anisodus acutangulus]
MAICNCFGGPVGRSRKDKGDKRATKTADEPVLVESSVKSTAKTDDSTSSSFVVPLPFGGSRSSVKVMNHESPVKGDTEEVAYEGEDEHDESLSMKRDNSDFDLQARGDQSFNEDINRNCSFENEMNDQDHNKSEEIGQSGHISDPGFGKVESWASPRLQRSCSDLAMRDMLTKLSEQLSLSKSKSFDEMQRLAEKMTLGSPANSVLTHCSADKVMLKKHSSTQLLPSRSRKLWWKLFLWSHRNLQGTGAIQQLPILAKTALNQQGGYSSDTLELGKGMDLSNLGSPGSFTGESLKKGRYDKGKEVLDKFQGVSGFWPQNQWVAFPEESSRFMRINEWVNELPIHPPCLIDEHDHVEDEVDASKSPARDSSLISPHPNINVPEEVAHANTVIRSLNSSSTVAHITGTGLKVIPAMSHLSSLRSVNLSGNFIVQITPGSLPKGLHVLNLSRNKIQTIEGLRELTRLRVLDLSYNRISRIGQGLSNCTLIKELYLAGNKISGIEGLHRLLKLTVLDLSFNKVTTTKALGQLVANYNSLLALNLLGNPIQINISDDQLRKAVRSLLPNLAFLNKQPINSQKAREVGSEAVAKAALGSSTRGTHRRATRKVNTRASKSSSVYRSSATVAQKSRHRL